MLLTVFVSLATFMEVLDMTIVNVSIPAISGTLGVSPTEGTWTISFVHPCGRDHAAVDGMARAALR